MTRASRLAASARTGEAPCRVLIVDDSAVARAALRHMVEAADAFSVAAVASGARAAIDWLGAHRVDIILLDLQMPGLGGHAALPELIAAGQGARILIVSSLAEAGARATLEAMALGATDALAKPAVGELGQRFAAELIARMHALGSVAVAPPPVAPPAPETVPLRDASARPIACLGIGASTGGIPALAQFFNALPVAFDVPILVTQHLPPTFMTYFAEHLAHYSGRACHVAEDGMPLVRGEVIIAPGARHLGVVRTSQEVCVALLDHEVASRCRPSVDPMFAGIADCYGDAAMGVVLTGMGRDGTEGACAIVAQGGTVIVQDAVSSAVWGMPGSVVRAGAASFAGAPATLAAHVACCGVAA